MLTAGLVGLPGPACWPTLGMRMTAAFVVMM